MKVVFLDIDGVISKLGPKGNLSLYGLSKPLLRNLSYLIKTSKSIIVLSSTWRMYPEARRRLDRQLRFKGLKISSQTPVHNGGLMTDRPGEIEQWLKEHPNVTEYVIIDDVPDYFTGDLRAHCVACDPEQGLTEEKVQEAFEILGVEDELISGEKT